MPERFWEIDFLRGIAIILMVFFHFLFDLGYFAGISIIAGSVFWFWFARITAAIFIFLMGISLTISYSRIKESPALQIYKKYLKRGLKIFGYGLIITLLTFLLFPKAFIFFGILHFIGVSIILAQFFLKWKWKSLALGAVLAFAGVFLQGFYFGVPGFVIAGQFPQEMYSFDFFQFLAWFWLVLIGIFAGHMLYPQGKRIMQIRDLGSKIIAKQLCWMGRHSLLIYFLHQPVLVAIILGLQL